MSHQRFGDIETKDSRVPVRRLQGKQGHMYGVKAREEVIKKGSGYCQEEVQG